jgi:hypothetical protein
MWPGSTESAVISQNDNFYIITPAEGRPSAAVRGKWLLFGQGEKVAGVMPEIDALVADGTLLGALVSRKSPDVDPFPHKDPLLAVYTTGEEKDIVRVRQVMLDRLGLVPQLWKSDGQTFADFKSGGWLRLEAKITELRREISDASTTTSDWQIEQLTTATKKLQALFAKTEGARKLEMELNHIDRFIEETEALLRSARRADR